MVNIPASPMEKLYIRMEQAREFGKAFDEEKERRVLGLPPVTDRPPVKIAASRERRMLTQREDIAGQRELAREAEAASAARQREENALLRAQIAELQEQIAELRGERVEQPAVAEAPPPGAPQEQGALPEGTPNMDWSHRQLVEFARQHEIALERGGFGMSKAAVLDAILGALEDAKQPGQE